MNRMETLRESAANSLVGLGELNMTYDWAREEAAQAVLAALGLDDMDAAAKRMERIDPRSVPDQESWHRAMLQEALSPLATEAKRDGYCPVPDKCRTEGRCLGSRPCINEEAATKGQQHG